MVSSKAQAARTSTAGPGHHEAAQAGDRPDDESPARRERREPRKTVIAIAERLNLATTRLGPAADQLT
jgi:hypothetical protein